MNVLDIANSFYSLGEEMSDEKLVRKDSKISTKDIWYEGDYN